MGEPITSWRESIAEGEEAMLEALAVELAELQRQKGGEHRGLHVKQHAGVRATLHVAEGLGGHVAQGLFARPGAYRAYVRFSNGSARAQHDRAPDLRGLAVKVLGVEGPKVLGDASTQDFLFIDNDTLPFRSPREFVTFVRCSQHRASLPFALFGKLGFRALGLLGALAREIRGDRGSLLDLAYHTVGAVSWGPYAARLHLEPLHHPSPHARPAAARDYLRDELAPRVRAGGVAYAITAQLATSDAESVEDVSSRWGAPAVRVGKLVLEADDPTSTAGQRLDAFVRGLSFDPWHCLTTHRPLGVTMRARKHAYFHSTRTRSAAGEPDGSEWGSFGAE